MTPREARSLVHTQVAALGIPLGTLTARTVSFQDLARAEASVVTLKVDGATGEQLLALSVWKRGARGFVLVVTGTTDDGGVICG